MWKQSPGLDFLLGTPQEFTCKAGLGTPQAHTPQARPWDLRGIRPRPTFDCSLLLPSWHACCTSARPPQQPHLPFKKQYVLLLLLLLLLLPLLLLLQQKGTLDFDSKT